MKILAIDTSNRPLSVAVLSNQRILNTMTTLAHRQHASDLLPVIENLMRNAGLAPTDLDRVVVAYGPGSYTGIRIASTTAKVLAFCLKIDLVAVSSLRTLALNLVDNENCLINPVFDARNQNLFTGLYRIKNGVPVNVIRDQHVSLANWLNQLRTIHQSIVGLGDADHFREAFKRALGKRIRFANPVNNVPQAARLAWLGEKLKPVTDVNAFVPNYLRLTPAQFNWRKRHPNASQNASHYVDRFDDRI